MKTLIQSAVLVGLILTAGCAKVKDDKEGVSVGNGINKADTPRDQSYLQMQADLSDAESVTTNVITKPGNEKKELLKVSRDGKISVVLKGPHHLLSYKITPHYIVARVDIEEGSEKCSLIAIPKVKGSTKVRCLNRYKVTCNSYTVTTNNGFDVRGDEVYFAFHRKSDLNQYNPHDCQESNGASTISELRKWDGKSEAVQTLFHSEPSPVDGVQPYVHDVFTSLSNENMCIKAENAGLICFDAKGDTWFKPNPENFPLRRTSGTFLKQGNILLTDVYNEKGNEMTKMNLADFSMTNRRGQLPDHIHFRRDNGRIIGTKYSTVIGVDPDGESKDVLENVASGAQPAGLDKWGWYFGAGTLRRIELDSGALDPKEYLTDSKLLSLSMLSWSLGDLLRVDGVGLKGMPSSSLMDSAGRLFSNETKSIPIEHPIDLAW